MSDTHRGKKRQAPTNSSNPSETYDNLSADEGMSVPGTATYDTALSQISGEKRRRKKFSSQRRVEVAKVRKIGACAECRRRRVRCSHVLQGTAALLNPTPTPKPSPLPPHHFDFDPSLHDKTYPEKIQESYAGQWNQSDEAESQDPPINDGSDMIDKVAASTRRQERLDIYLDEFDNIIGDNSQGSEASNVSCVTEWGQSSQWMMNAISLTNNQQTPLSPTAYSYSVPNFSSNARPLSSTPASSTADLRSLNTHNAGHYRCDVQGCERPRTFPNEKHLRSHQEIKHADLFPPQITYACQAVECSTKRYATVAALHTHLKCNHPEALESPIELPTLNVSDRNIQPDRRAQVDEFVAGQYVAGMEDDSSATPNQMASAEISSLTRGSWRRAESCREAPRQRVKREPNMRPSNSPMIRQLSAKIANDPAQKLPAQNIVPSSDCGISYMATSSYALVKTQDFWDPHTIEPNNFVIRQGLRQSNPHRSYSPAPSLSGQFAQHMQISNPSSYKAPGGIRENVSNPAVQSNHLRVFAAEDAFPLHTSATFEGDLAPVFQSEMAGNQQTLHVYDNSGRTQLANSFYPGYNGSVMGARSWSGEDHSTSEAQTGRFSSGYALMPSGSQGNILDAHYAANDGSSMIRPVAPSLAKQPMIMLNDRALLHTGPDADYAVDPRPFDSNLIFSKPNDLPNLVHSNFSSSGASGSLVSPLDDLNLFSTNFGGDDWELASSLFLDWNAMDINPTNETK